MSESSKAVFLSYASQDAEAVLRICEALRAAGVEVWFDQSELRGGDAWDAKIRKQIKECALFAPVISKNTQARLEGYFRLEWRLADQRSHLMARGKPFLLPVVVDDTRDQEAHVPDSFLEVQWTRLRGGETPVAFCERVTALLYGEVGARTSPSGFVSNAGETPALPGKRAWAWLGLGIVGVVAMGAFAFWQPWRKGDGGARPASADSPLVSVAKPGAADPLARVRAILAQTDVVRAELDTAVGLVDGAIKVDGANAEALALRALVDWRYAVENLDHSPARLDAMRQHGRQAMSLDATNPTARLAQAQAMVLLNDTATTREAAVKLLEPLAQDPNVDVQVLLALGWIERSSREKALAYFERAARIPGSTGQAHFARAMVYFRERQFQAATDAIDQALAAQRAAKFLFWKSYLQLVWEGDAVAAERTSRDLPPDLLVEDFVVSFRYIVQVFQRDYDGALATLRSFPRDFIGSGDGSGTTGYFKGFVLAQAGKTAAAEIEWRAALDVVERRMQAAPNERGLLVHKAILLASLGDKPAAEKLWRATRELFGESAAFWGEHHLRLLLLADDDALDYLAAEIERPRPATWVLAGSLRLDLYLDRLRAHPRFAALVARAEADPRLSPRAARTGVTAANGDAATPEKSLAVLAFDNLSDDKANEYFSDGISEELLTVLQKIPGLRLAARTSAFSFKGKNATVREVGEKLGVAHVVTGSVQKSGNRVKITVRLNRASTNEDLWAKSFAPMELTDVFATQSEIAQAIVAELRGRLTGEAAALVAAQIHAAEIGGTRNIEAHELHLRGKFFANQFTLESLRRAEGVLRRAVALDPAFALAWASLAKVGRSRSGFEITRADAEAGFELAREASARAVELAPNLAAAHLARLHFQLLAFEWKEAVQSLRRVQELSPDEAYPSELRVAGALGDRERAVAAGRRAIALDPVNPELRVNFAWALLGLRRFEEAEAEFRRAAELSPTAPYGRAGVGIALLLQGRAAEATAEAARENTDWTRRFALALTRWGEGRRAESDAALEELVGFNAETGACQIVEVHAFRGEPDRSFEWLERALRQRDPGLITMKTNPLLDALHADARWPAFLKKIGLSDEQLK